MKIYTTKYALSKGIEEKEGEENGDYYSVKGSWILFRKNRDAFLSREEAVTKAQKMVAQKISSLKKSLKKLESLNFNRPKVQKTEE